MAIINVNSSRKVNFLLFGGSGLIGNYIKRELVGKNTQVFSPRSKDCDIADRQAVQKLFTQIKPGFVIHSAGFVSTEGCEFDPGKAKEINIQGTVNIVKSCERGDIPLLFLSSDYVFDGTQDFYNEDDERHPLNVYGWTKMMGEDEVRKLSKHYIVRSSIVFGKGGTNLVNRIIGLEERTRLPVDKIRCPTYAQDLAEAVSLFWVKSLPYGTYHITNQGYCSNFALAQEILRILKKAKDLVKPASLDEIPSIAKVARRLVLKNTNWLTQGLPLLRPYQDSLREYLIEALKVVELPPESRG